MSNYNDYINQFEVFENPSKKKGLHRHHIVPVSQQKKLFGEVTDNKQVYVTKAQHLWLHILYDKENNTNTASSLLSQSNLSIDNIKCYEDCLSFNNVPSGMEGKHHSEEARKKMSENASKPNLGKHLSDKTKDKISNSLIGHKVSEESRKKISTANKGKQFSEETRKKMSIVRKGRHHSEEARKKISIGNKGKQLSEETRKKISKSCKCNTNAQGHTVSEDARKKISKSLKGRSVWNKGLTGKDSPLTGRKYSEEHKNNISKAKQNMVWWNNGKVNTMSINCPGDEWVRGQIRHSKL